jgi:nicotinate-nucleotide--dimethylbenzimidazole phosphoribosyltransferase
MFDLQLPGYPDAPIVEAVRQRSNQLTKPPGSLGRLEDMVEQLAQLQHTAMPSTARRGMFLFCGDHGITAEGISAWPSEVTQQMALNFIRGGAAISVLCRHNGVTARVINAGMLGDNPAGVEDLRIASGTKNFLLERAMTREQALDAVQRGRALAREAAANYDLVGAGEMGIGNTTSAAALFSLATGLAPRLTVGAGAGASQLMVSHKAEVIQKALQLHQPDRNDAIDMLSAVGGFEIAMMTGFYVGAAESSLAVVVDGFICTAAALMAEKLATGILPRFFFAHRSAERGHTLAMESMNVKPMLDLGLRLGEGSGALLGIQLLHNAVLLYREMATFGEAAVSEKS